MIVEKGNLLYSGEDVAKLFGVCRQTIVNRARQAGLKRRIVQRVRYFTEEDVCRLQRLTLQTHRPPTEEEIRRTALPARREFLDVLTKRRGVLLRELTETDNLLQSTLLFETEEETHLRESARCLRESLHKLDSCLYLLEENIRRVEYGEEI